MRVREVMVESWKCWKDPAHPTRTVEALGWPACADPDCNGAPQPNERWAWVSPRLSLNLYAPPPSAHGDADESTERQWAGPGSLAPGSAIVGIPDDPQVYFEGFVHGAHGPGHENPFATWTQGVAVAANRLVTRYPTIARGNFPDARWTRVGIFVPFTGLIQVSNPTALGQWLGADVPPPYTRHQ